MAPHDLSCVLADLIQSAADHFMGYCICKEHEQIRPSNLFIQAGAHLGKYLCLTFVIPANLLILAYHAVMASDNDNAHVKSSFFGVQVVS